MKKTLILAGVVLISQAATTVPKNVFTSPAERTLKKELSPNPSPLPVDNKNVNDSSATALGDNPAAESTLENKEIALPKLETEKSDGGEDKYKKIISILEQTSSFQETDELKKAEAKTLAAEEEKNFKKREAKEEIFKMLLPIPKSSIQIGESMIVYAVYREKTILESKTDLGARPNASIQQNQGVQPQNQSGGGLLDGELFGFSENDISYEAKTIELKKGDVFGEWMVEILAPNFVQYAKKSDPSQTVKKYF